MEMHPKSEVEEKLSPNWLDLPREVTVSILQKLNAADILENVEKVCTQWETICKEPSLWRSITFRNYFNPSLFKQAVLRSCGDLIDLNLRHFISDELLDYVTQRCTKIKRLRLVQCYWISEVGFCEAAQRLPLLEELEVSCCDFNDLTIAKALDEFGECCPLLKSVKINRRKVLKTPTSTWIDDSEALSIAGNMVELRHLQLFGNRMTNKGLMAILDNCSHLESLDLRQCFNLDLEDSSLGKRCTETIKYFREPYDSTDDYEYNAYAVATPDSDDYEYDQHDFDHFDSDDMGSGFINLRKLEILLLGKCKSVGD